MIRTEKQKSNVIGVDIGGTKMLAAIFDARGKVIDSLKRPTRAEQGVRATIESLGELIENLIKRQSSEVTDISGIGIACAGGIDTKQGIVATPSPNLPDWVNVPLVKIIQERLHIKTFIINDASAAALGEHRFGAGRKTDDLVLFTVGTGIGGGIIADGKVYLGAVGAAAEFGHMTIDTEGPKCGCGNTGCLEMLASGRAVEREAVKRIKEGRKSSILALADNNADNITAELVGSAAKEGDKLACEIIEHAAYYLGIGMINVVNIFNPQMIIIGGGMAELGERIIEPGRRMVGDRAFPISARTVQIVTAELGNEAGIYGAAVYAREESKRRKR